MSEEAEAKEPPAPELVKGEYLFWKKADMEGLVLRHMVTGYLVTNYRCFIWDVEKNAVTVNVPISLADVTVEGKRQGKRARQGGTFIVPQTINYAQPTMGESVEIGALVFRVKGEPVMVFHGVAEPAKVKMLIDALRVQLRAHQRAPRESGVESLWRGSGEPAGHSA
jgi:hypothetical protein